MSLSRRSFLKKTAMTSAAMTVTGGIADVVVGASATALAPGAGNKWPGRVVINFNKNAVTISGINAAPVISVIQKMVNDAVLRLTGETTLGAAWKAVFPSSLTAASKIAIKITTANSGLPAPHWSSVKAITDGLQQMDFNGTKFPAANITLYETNVTGATAAGFTSANFGSAIKIVNDSVVAGGDGALNNRTYASSLKNANFLINVFSPRGHNIGSNFTLGFKSHFGTYSNASGLHASAAQNLRDINCSGVVYNKTVLSVCSGIFGMNESHGPTGAPDPFLIYAKTMDASVTNANQPPTTIIISTDPVAAEMQTIKMMRLNKNPAGKFGVSDMPTYLQASAGITTALSDKTYNIGILDESQMDVRRIINDVTGIGGHPQNPATSTRSSLIVTPVVGCRNTFIEFLLPSGHIGRDARIEIFDSRGRSVYQHSQKALGAMNHFSWNNRDRHGLIAGPGVYVAHLVAGPTRIATRFSIP